jgi:hypothetical protein
LAASLKTPHQRQGQATAGPFQVRGRNLDELQVSGAHHTTIGTNTETMARLRSLLQQVCSLLLLLAVGSHALKFDIQAGSGHDKNSRRCIRNFVSKDMLVVVTAIVDGYKGDGMQLNMHVGAAGAMRTPQTRC